MKWKVQTPEQLATLELTLDSDDPKLIEMIEQSAEASGMIIERIKEDDDADR